MDLRGRRPRAHCGGAPVRSVRTRRFYARSRGQPVGPRRRRPPTTKPTTIAATSSRPATSTMRGSTVAPLSADCGDIGEAAGDGEAPTGSDVGPTVEVGAAEGPAASVAVGDPAGGPEEAPVGLAVGLA